jgi:hypothetical protein
VKFLIFFWTLLLYFNTSGQESKQTYSSFAIDNKEVIWVQVYHTQESATVLAEHALDFLKRQAWIRNAHFDGREIVADIQDFRIDYKRYGGKYMNTSNLIRTAKWSGKTRITFKDGKYRVIVYGLEYVGRQPAMHAGKMSNQPHEIQGTWTDWVLNKYRTDFRKSRHTNMDILHFNLKDRFTLKQTELIDEDW